MHNSINLVDKVFLLENKIKQLEQRLEVLEQRHNIIVYYPPYPMYQHSVNYPQYYQLPTPIWYYSAQCLNSGSANLANATATND